MKKFLLSFLFISIFLLSDAYFVSSNNKKIIQEDDKIRFIYISYLEYLTNFNGNNVKTNKATITKMLDNVKYYNDYIEQKKADGISEQEILEELGSPRLIAKSIIDSHTANNSKTNRFSNEYENSFRQENKTYEREKDNLENDNSDTHGIAGKIHKVLSAVLSVIVVMLVAFIIVSIIGGLITITVNILIPIIAVVLVIAVVVGFVNNFIKH